jgi:hypothetical protein
MTWSDYATFGFAAFGFLRVLIELNCILFPNNRVSRYFRPKPPGFFTSAETVQLAVLIKGQREQVALLRNQIDLLQTLVVTGYTPPRPLDGMEVVVRRRR